MSVGLLSGDLDGCRGLEHLAEAHEDTASEKIGCLKNLRFIDDTIVL
jgi:hypothetical protein